MDWAKAGTKFQKAETPAAKSNRHPEIRAGFKRLFFTERM
jgi:hypothetical protein